jgi:hypothetical protein
VITSQNFIPTALQNSGNSTLSDAAADAKWGALFPPNGGLIQTEFSVAIFRAIHCLNALREVTEVFFDVASHETNKIVANRTAGDFFHMQYCLRPIYLRQMVMCPSNPTLEQDILLPNEARFILAM